MGRTFAWLLMMVAASASAQVRTARGNGTPAPPPASKAAYNSMSKDTTPFNCEQYRRHPHPSMVGFCQSIETMTLQNEAQRAGRPGPSSSVVALPALGSPESAQLGYACIGGQAFRRLSNGWEQVHSPDGGWQRCRGG